MLSPFPGMDPYLEQSTFWSSFHSRLIVAIADAIEPQLSWQYYVEVETRTYWSEDGNESLLVGIPDAVVFSERSPVSTSEPMLTDAAARRYTDSYAIATQPQPERVAVPLPLIARERYLEVREMGTDEVVTAIAILSPKNKRSGDGRRAYEKKRRAILGSATHLVELDLLRGGQPMAILGVRTTTSYRILISRSHQRPAADLYGVVLQQELPNLPIPLKPDDPEPIVPLQEIFNGVYDRARYASRIDYDQPIPPPALSESDRQWVETVWKERERS
jgi:Protein of unknown function (DUF4058)